MIRIMSVPALALLLALGLAASPVSNAHACMIAPAVLPAEFTISLSDIPMNGLSFHPPRGSHLGPGSSPLFMTDPAVQPAGFYVQGDEAVPLELNGAVVTGLPVVPIPGESRDDPIVHGVSIPESSTLFLLGFGLAAVGGIAWRRRTK